MIRYILVVRMEVVELKIAQLDRKISKKLKSLNALKLDQDKKPEKQSEKQPEKQPENIETANLRKSELKELTDNIKNAIDSEFQKFLNRSCE